MQQIDAVQIWNRTDASPNRLSNFYVFISDEPFTSNDPHVLAADPHVWHHYVSGAAGRTTTIPVDEYGPLRAGAVGRPGLPATGRGAGLGPPWRAAAMAQRQAGQQQHREIHADLAGRPDAGRFRANSCTRGRATRPISTSARASTARSSSIGLGQEGETITGGSTSNKAKLGMEIKYVDASVSYGVEQETSYILSWSNEVNFNGKVGGLPASAPYEYYYAPYVWLQRATSSGGVGQAFFVLDYWLPSTIPATNTADEPKVAGPRNSPTTAPAIPLLDSPTHPDPATWVATNTATFTWAQPPGDPAPARRLHLEAGPDAGHSSARFQPGAGHDQNLPRTGRRSICTCTCGP